MTTALKVGQPRFLEVGDAELINVLTVETHGGLRGVRDSGLLESALAQARAGAGGQYLHEFPFGMAAAYAFHIARNHPFLDGNKRTAFAVAAGFLHLHGWRLTTPEVEAAEMMERAAAGLVDKAELARWFESACRPRPSFELRDFFAMLDVDRLSDTIEAAAATERVSELEASLEEAGGAMPLIAVFREGAAQARAEGNEELARHLDMDAAMFASLYRIAEDMGYEW